MHTIMHIPAVQGYLPLWARPQGAKPRRSRRALTLSLAAIICIGLLLWRSSRDFASDTWLSFEGSSMKVGYPGAPKALLVSAYFPFASAKHSQDDYNTWLGNFVSNITTDLYFFTTPEMAETVRRLRGDLPIIINTYYKSPFDIELLKDRREQVERMHQKDRERDNHNPNLYAIWAAKSFFVNEALHHVDNLFFRRTERPRRPPDAQASSMGSRYRYVFWLDCGSFRNPHVLRDWPDVTRVDEVWREGARRSGSNAEDLVFIPMLWGPQGSTENWKEEEGPIDIDMSEGSFFGGHPGAMRWWYRAYFTYFISYADKGMFVGKDQTLMNALSYLFPKRIINVWYDYYEAPERGSDGQLGACGDAWYYFEYWLASPEEQLAQATAWDETRERQCRITSVMSFTQVLRYAFGPDWTAPTPTLPLIEDI